MLSFMNALVYHLYGEDEGLFSEKFYKKYLIYHVSKVFNFHDWERSISTNLDVLKKLLKDKKKSCKRIRAKLISDLYVKTQIRKLMSCY